MGVPCVELLMQTAVSINLERGPYVIGQSPPT